MKKPKSKNKTSKLRKQQSEIKNLAAYEHSTKRKNIPEVGLVNPENDPDQPKTKWSYDPHLAPELRFDPTTARARVESLITGALATGDRDAMAAALKELRAMQSPFLQWTGKAEKTSFDVDTVSLHVHEKIDPATVLRGIRSQEAQETPIQGDLFAQAFQPRPLREAMDFYGHDRGWANRFVLGDSLVTMNSLLRKEGMCGQVQIIYFDPPYGITYDSNFQPFVNTKKVTAGADEDLTSEPEMIKAFRDTWELGIHSYLAYLRDRLLLSRDLLSRSGSLFLQISDENVHLVRCLLDEIFGADQFVAQIYFQTAANQNSKRIQRLYDCLLWYGNGAPTKFRDLFRERQPHEVESIFTGVDAATGERFKPAQIRTPEQASRLAKAGRLTPDGSYAKRYVTDFPLTRYDTVWTGTIESTFSRDKVYVVQTNKNVIERAMLMASDPGDLVLDITCGSGTTAYVAEKWGRRWITCDTSRVALTLAKQRLMSATFDYYALKYPEEGVRSGFVYRSLPRVTLSGIASNPDIDAIHARFHPAVETALRDLASILGKPDLVEAAVPTVWPNGWPDNARAAFTAFNKARNQLREHLDTAILSHADKEVLYDQPAVDRSKVRITGPFTVEATPFPSVQVLDTAEEPPDASVAVARSGETSRQSQWRDELLKTGIRGKGGAKIEFASLETQPGTQHIQATGTTVAGDVVAVCFGPEHAPLEQRAVARALEEASSLVPKPKMVIFAAFAFDPEAAKDIEETKWSGVTLLRAEMNTDLLTEDLKKARATNESFWLVGQPDVEVKKDKDGTVRVIVHGFDYFDPRSGELHSGGKSKIALWMLDTDYDGRALYPRQVFFPMAGAKDGWNKLSKDLKALLDEKKLEAFTGTESLPFKPGAEKRAAVKIVDDRGIESLKILPLG